MPLKLIDYIPDPIDLDPSVVIATRRRLDAYLSDFWPELDTRPNSVFGDIYLTPEATLMTACEVAMERFKSDLDLGNVASGKVYNVDFVEAFLKNFGVDSGLAVHSTGVIRMIFNNDQQYTIGHQVTFNFGSKVYKINPEEDNPLIIYPTGSDKGKRILTPASDGAFEVHVPVVGPAGESVNHGEPALISEDVEGLTDVMAAGTFDSGRLEDSIVMKADRARRQFASISLTSRSGARSLISLLWPGLVGDSAIVTGDKEMLRTGINPLGVKEGALDLFVRTSPVYVTGETSIVLTYDSLRNIWVGRLVLPCVPAFFSTSAGIFQAAKFGQSQGASAIYARSSHPTVDNLGVAYSKYEVLGIEVEDTSPTSFTPSVNGPVTYSTSGVVSLNVSGEYAGYRFNRYSQRSVIMRFDRLAEVDDKEAIVANVRDKISGETTTVYFLPNTETNPSKGVIHFDDGYRNMFNGMQLEVTPTSGQYVPGRLLGMQFEFAYQGRTSSFVVSYLYDPSLIKVDNMVQSPDYKPVNVDIFVRNFIICHVTQFTITCRTRYGQTLDWETLRNRIVLYVNGITYPRQYQDAVVMTFMQSSGAVDVHRISKRGTFYPSLARVYVDKDGVESAVSRIDTTTLLPPLNDSGFGPRNIAYLLEPDTIQFNAISSAS